MKLFIPKRDHWSLIEIKIFDSSENIFFVEIFFNKIKFWMEQKSIVESFIQFQIKSLCFSVFSSE